MDELIRSAAAAASMADFFPKTVLFWVEGETDKLFYEVFLGCIGESDFKVKDAKGKVAIREYAQKLVDDDEPFCVITDSDYDDYLKPAEKLPKNPKLIKSDGHSLENMLYSPKIIERIIYLKSKQAGEYAEDFDQWRINNFDHFQPLIALDILNEIHHLGIKILDKNFDQFVQVKNGCNTCIEKIELRISQLESSHAFSTMAQRRIAKPKHKVIRGHFYEKGVRAYILDKSLSICGKKVSLSDDELFEKAVAIMEADATRLDSYRYLRYRIRRAVNIVKSQMRDLDVAS